MHAPHVRGRRRALTQPKKVELCDHVGRGATIEEAADVLGVSLRTVQREMKLDEDFHHEVRLAEGAAPDPLKLMQRAARAHWRAAAWLLERTDPEHYGKRPKNSATRPQLEAALRFVIEAALEAVAPEEREKVYERVDAARQHALKCVFPNYGPWGQPLNPQIPPTPLADERRFQAAHKPGSPYQVPAHAPDVEPPTRQPQPRSHQPARDASSRVQPEAPAPVPKNPPAPSHRSEGLENGEKRVHHPVIKPTAPTSEKSQHKLAPHPPRILSPKTHFTTEHTPNDAPQNGTPFSRDPTGERAASHQDSSRPDGLVASPRLSSPKSATSQPAHGLDSVRPEDKR